MELIVPSLKVLAGLDPAGASASVGLTVVDLNRRTRTYERPDLRLADPRRDWFEMRPSFELSGAAIDAKTLAGQRKMLDYFAVEATRLLGSSSGNIGGMAHVLIVLSAPVFFEQQEKSPAPDLPPDPGRRVYYISYSPIANVVEHDPASSSNRVLAQRPLYLFSDDLARMLKPAGARVFRVSRPEEFRKALGAILDEIAEMPASRLE
jgi:hypothetical protein